jgi:hypothetical protein
LTSTRKRLLIAGVTFLAGLYFILEFLVPPTIPGTNVTGVVLATTPARVTLADGAVVEISPDAKPFSRRQTAANTTQTLDYAVRDLEPGMRVSFLKPPIQQKVIRSIDFGSVTLREGGRTETVALGKGVLIGHHNRSGGPNEIENYEAGFGQTVTIGKSAFFIDHRDTSAQFNNVVLTLAVGVGLFSLAYVNGRKLRRREEDWYTAVFFFAATILGVVTGIFKYYPAGSAERGASDLVIFRFITTVGSTIFSLLAFYMASAAYRAFRIRSKEAALMMISALIVMLGQTPFGMYLTGWLGEQYSYLWLPNIAGWLLRTPITAMFRGLILGIMVGAIGTALRYWLNLEKSAAMGDSP